MIRIGIDTGGTFTDFVISDAGKVTTFKLPSTPGSPETAVLEGLKRIVSESDGFEVRHGSTVATNALLERKGAKTALITSQGFEDILEIGRQNRPHLYSFEAPKPEALVPAEGRIGVKERTLHDGTVLIPLEKKSLDWLSGRIGQLKPDSIAVVLLYSYLNPENETRILEALESYEVPISLSHRVHPEFREYERTSATVVNAYLTPIMTRYLTTLTQDPLMEKGRLTVMQSNGGSISGQAAMQEPIRTLLSGPAGGVVGAFNTARAAGYDKVITLDMGGTSTDVCLCDGAVRTTNEAQVDRLPIPTPTISIHTIGAGGGSIARIDSGGLLKVGPVSAGADPGPVAYGRGEAVTVTDAHIMLGALQPDYFLGGEVPLQPEKVKPALEGLAARLGRNGDAPLDAEAVAAGIIRITDAQMERAIRLISLQRGFDSRDFTLVTFGGCGGLHACRLARSLMIPRVLVPPEPGLLSAAGILNSDIVTDVSRTVFWDSSESDLKERIDRTYAELKEQLARDMEREGFDSRDLQLGLSLDARYPGQSYEINVDMSDDFVADFHEKHSRFYGYSNPNLPVEIVTLRIRATGSTDRPERARSELGSELPAPESILQESTISIEGEKLPARFYSRNKLSPGNRLEGPAVVVEYSSTTLVPQGYQARVDEWFNLLISERDRSAS